MTVLIRCDEPGCDAETENSDAMPAGYFPNQLRWAWQTYYPPRLGDRHQHYCPKHHREWP